MSFYPRNPSVGKIQSSTGTPNDQAFVAHFSCVPGTADPNGILAAQATSTSTTSVTTFLAQPSIATCIEVLPTGTTTDVSAGAVTITGTDISGAAITDTVTFAANASTKQVTTKAFATVTQVDWIAQDGNGATFDVGWGKVIGLPDKRPHPTLLKANFDNAADTGTETAHATVLAANVFSINGTPNSAKVLDVYYMV